MFHANMKAFYESLVVMVVATPFMFLTMTLFWLLAAGLSRLPHLKKEDK
jgi:hypothetical protein